MTESSIGTSSTSVWNRLKSNAPIIALLLAVFMAGLVSANTINSSIIKWLEIDNANKEKELNIARAELMQVKSEYNSYRLQYSSQSSSTLNNSSTNNSEKQTDEVTIGLDSTANLFDDSLFITLITTSYEGSPLRYKVLATIGSPGYQNQPIDLKDAGYVTTYQGKDKFEIRIIEAKTFSAKFLVTRIQ